MLGGPILISICTEPARNTLGVSFQKAQAYETGPGTTSLLARSQAQAGPGEHGVWGAMEQKTDISSRSECRRRRRQASRT